MAPKGRSTGGAAPGESSASASDSHAPGRRKSTSGSRDGGPGVRRASSTVSFTPGPSPGAYRLRRSSTFSDMISETNRAFQEDIISPGPFRLNATTWRSWLPMVFAVIPPVAGLFFKNGMAFCNDLILLGLASVLLHWSTTAPWEWYYSAQQVRDDEDAALEKALEMSGEEPTTKSDSDAESPLSPAEKYKQARLTEAALDQLRTLEVMALVGCFLAPAAATYFLYITRNFLNWPSEGLFSNFNLGIVLLATEVGPLSHAIKLVLQHTLHLQRIVNSNPYRMVRITPTRYRDLLSRIGDLEARVLAPPDDAADGGGGGGHQGCQCSDPERQQAMIGKMRDEVTQQVRAALHPEIDAVVRAVRRYEKKSSTLTHDTEQQMLDLRRRLDDAIALSAVVARNGAERGSMMGKVARGGLYVVTFPVTAIFWTVSMVSAPLALPKNWLASSGRRLIAAGETQGHGQGQGLPGQVQARQRRSSSGSARYGSRPS